jgi:hypothetical protein
MDRLDELAQNPEFAEQVAAEREREERYSHFPKGEGAPRRDGDRPRRDGDRPRHDGDRHRDRESGEGRPVRRFDRDRNKRG